MLLPLGLPIEGDAFKAKKILTYTHFTKEEVS